MSQLIWRRPFIFGIMAGVFAFGTLGVWGARSFADVDSISKEYGLAVTCSGVVPDGGYAEPAVFVQYFGDLITGAVQPPETCPDSPFVRMVALRQNTGSAEIAEVYAAPASRARLSGVGTAARYGADLVLLGIMRLECGETRQCLADRLIELSKDGYRSEESMVLCDFGTGPSSEVISAFEAYEGPLSIQFACGALTGDAVIGEGPDDLWWEAFDTFSGKRER